MAQAPSADSARPSARDRKIEILIGIVLIAVAIAAIAVATGFRSSGLKTDIGPARFPMLYAAILITLCAILVISNAFRLRRGDCSQASPIAKRSIVMTASGIVLTYAAYLAMDTAGYGISMFVYLCVLMALMGMRHKLINPVLSAAITGALYLAFDMLLKVPLPIGSLFE